MSVRVRFAPSPTGYLHVGGARTALYNYLYAKRFGGEFIYRIEDTDVDRSTEDSLRMQIEDMVWLGLRWNEGPDPATLKDVGPCGPYRQSQRQALYLREAERLVENGSAYYCFLTDDEMEKMRQEAGAEEGFQLRSPYRDTPASDAKARLAAGAKATIRFKTPEVATVVSFDDLIRGEVALPSSMVGDFVLIRSSGMPVYNFCCVVDDALMGITHVLRAEEHLNNTLRQLLLYRALGLEVPRFGHMSLILGADKKKLSKRHGATSCHEYRQQGFLPSAVKNYIALLGWSHPEGLEIFDVEDIESLFSTERMTASPAVFDDVKLRWVNAQHLKKLSLAEIGRRVGSYLTERGVPFESDNWLIEIVRLLQPRLEIFDDVAKFIQRLRPDGFRLDPGAEEIWTFPSTEQVLNIWRSRLARETGPRCPLNFVAEVMDQIKTEAAVKGKPLFMPLRVAVTGQAHGVEIQPLVPLMDREELVRRVDFVRQSRGSS